MTNYTRFAASMLLAAVGVPSFAQTATATLADVLPGKCGMSAVYDRVKQMRHKQVQKNAQASGVAAWRAAAEDAGMGEFEDFGWLSAPNGEYWYYTVNYRYINVGGEDSWFKDLSISGFTLNVYDTACKLVGTVDADLPLLDDEIRISAIDFSDVLTKKFFNVDNNYEVMVLVNANTPKYINNVRTYAYSITTKEGKSEPVATLDGMMVASIDASPDQWAENYYLVFDNDGYANPDGTFTPATGTPQENAVRGQRFTIFKKAGYSGGPSEVDCLDVTADEANYSGGLPILIQKQGSTLYIAKTGYEKPYLVDPYDYTSMEVTPDNHLVITLYTMPLDSYGTVKLEEKCKTSIAMTENPSEDVPLRFYGVGTLDYMNDMQIGADGMPTYTVVAEDYHISTDGSYYSFYQYDADGQLQKSIFDDANNFFSLSPIDGHPEQMLFVTRDENDVFGFHFVNMDNFEEVLSLPAAYEENTLTSAIDRVPAPGGSYDYVVRMGMTEKNADGHLCECINVFHADGSHAYKRLLYLGSDVAMAIPNIVGNVLNPYFINTDDQREYFFLVARYTGVSSKTRTELLVVNDAGETVFRVLPDESQGSITRVWTFNTDTDPRLVIVYRKPDYEHYYTEIYPLPMTNFAGGTGTLADPYQIATVGDLQQIYKYPEAHFSVVSDMDGSLATLHGSSMQFKGTLKGNGHVISNLYLAGSNCSLLGNIIGDGESETPNVSDLTFANVTLSPEGTGAAGLLAQSALQGKVENVHVYGMKVLGDNFNGNFGGLLGSVSVMSNVNACSVQDAAFSLPTSESVGGICASLRTSSAVNACNFSGTAQARCVLGGIVGEVYESGSLCSITNCHVNADLTAEHTVGGIVGSDNHNQIAHNIVEGSLTSSKGSKWNGPCIGGVVGVLEKSVAGKVEDNVVNLSALNFTPSTESGYAYETAHRVVGMSVYNEYGEETDDGLSSNYVVDNISPISSKDLYAGATGTEGESIAAAGLTKDFFSGLAYAYGDTSDSPWTGNAVPALYFENKAMGLVAVSRTIEMEANATGEMFFVAPGGKGDDIQVSVPDNEVIDVAYIENRGNSKVVAFETVKSGEVTVTATCGIYTAQCVVKVNQWLTTGIDAAVADVQPLLGFDGMNLVAGRADATIKVCDASGRMVAAGAGALSVGQLPSGVYVAVSGNTSLKFIVR